MCVCVCVCVCVYAEPRLHARRISLGGEGNALYPVFSRSLFTFSFSTVLSVFAAKNKNDGVDDVYAVVSIIFRL